MPRLPGFKLIIGVRLLICLTCVAALVVAPGTAGARSLDTAIYDPAAFDNASRDTAFQHVADAGASLVRLSVSWSRIAPEGFVKPDGFDARDPMDPAYRFEALDAQVVAARAAGLQPIVTIVNAPLWAERGNVGRQGIRNPDPAEAGEFAEALARRYSGSVPGLPRVRYWQLWNEPNLFLHFMPQFETPFDKDVQPGTPAVSPVLYRKLARAMARAIRGVDASNKLIAGGLAPFGHADKNRHAVRPLRFMREFLCLTDANRPKPGCKPVRFDIWSTHPYTEGGPFHSAASLGNVSLGDLPEMRGVLDAARRTGQVGRHVQFWVTEFSWDTRPPDSGGVPIALHIRWVAEALYNMWTQHVRVVTWFKIRDDEITPHGPNWRNDSVYSYQSGLFARCGDDCYQAKQSLRAFRFPFVAFGQVGHVKVWGRTPYGKRARVVIEQRRKRGGWRRLARLRTTRSGIFISRLRRHGPGAVRARIGGNPGERSLPYKLESTPDADVRIFGDE